MILMGIILISSIAVMLLGATLFTNGIEWFGKRVNASEGAVGSIFAGVGTALPETVIPIVAILFGTTQEELDVGVGAIIGAPFMLTTLTLPLLGAGLLIFASLQKRSPSFSLDYDHVKRDLRYFLVPFGLAILVTLSPHPILRIGLAVFLILIYVQYLKGILGKGEHSGGEIGALYFYSGHNPPPYWAISLQILLSLGVIIGAAHFFVHGVTDISKILGVSPLILSLLITPVATELPEKLNSLIWIYQKKDTLAVGNITGAMVFQGTFPVSIGLIGTSWQLNHFAITSASLALLSALIFYLFLKFRGHWKPVFLIAGALFYLVFGLYLQFH
ncbi:MAG TPA: sodium:calcium antiporter [Nitrospiria bacterium]|jgi:cation:H+ antiporter